MVRLIVNGVCVYFPLSIFKCLINGKSQFREKKNTVLPFEKCPSLSLPGNATLFQHLIIQSKINKVL